MGSSDVSRAEPVVRFRARRFCVSRCLLTLVRIQVTQFVALSVRGVTLGGTRVGKSLTGL